MSYVYLELDVSINPIEPWRPIMIAHMGELSFESFLNTKKVSKLIFPIQIFQKMNLKDYHCLKKKMFLLSGLQKNFATKLEYQLGKKFKSNKSN